MFKKKDLQFKGFMHCVNRDTFFGVCSALCYTYIHCYNFILFYIIYN